MTIKDMELQTGLARANIRYYEAEGLISPERAENGYREYSQEDAETLLRVKLLRALGLTVGQIKAIVRGETELDAALSARIAAIQKEKAALDRAGEIAGRSACSNVIRFRRSIFRGSASSRACSTARSTGRCGCCSCRLLASTC